MFQEIANAKTVKEIENLTKQLNEMCEKRREEIIVENYSNELANKQFGYIKEGFENLSGVLFENKDTRKYIKRYVNCIKENKDLSKMHMLYECVRKADKEDDMQSYLSEAVSMIGEIDRPNFKKGVKKLGAIFAEAYRAVGKTDGEIEVNGDRIDEAVEYIAFKKKTPSNLSDYNKCVRAIKEHVQHYNTSSAFGKKNIDEVAGNLIDEFNQKYANELGNNGVAAIKEIAVGGTLNQETFEKCKNECVERISNAKALYESKGEKDSVEKLEMVLEKVTLKEYNPETVNEDIKNLIDLKNCID